MQNEKSHLESFSKVAFFNGLIKLLLIEIVLF